MNYQWFYIWSHVQRTLFYAHEFFVVQIQQIFMIVEVRNDQNFSVVENFNLK